MEKTAKVSPGFSASLRSFSHLDVVLSVASMAQLGGEILGSW